MNARLLATLLGMRYRLLWALVRTRKGRVTLFLLGYVLAILIIALLVAGGFGAALASVRLGKAELVARVALGSVFLAATLAAVLLGFGMGQTFSDAALRRYPVTVVQRLAARQLTALLDPLWLFVLAVYLGLASGFCVFGAGTPWLAAPGAVMLLLTNYMLARLVASLIDRIMATRAGPVILLALFLAVSMGPALIGPGLRRNSAIPAAGTAVAKLTPPFAAAAALTSAPAPSSFAQAALLVAWCLGLGALLLWLERLPMPSRVSGGGAAEWDSSFDRFAALFGTGLGPLVGKMLRYYIRSNFFRYSFPFAIPMCVVLVVQHSHGRADPMRTFLVALGAVCVGALIGAGGMSFNVFGLTGHGFRRYLLLPASSRTIVHAATVVPLLLGAVQIPIMLGLWLLLAPVHTDLRMASMLLSNALGALFLSQALALWTSLLMPREADYSPGFGGKGSKPAVWVMITLMMSFMALPELLSHWGAPTVLRYWWVSPLFAFASLALFAFTVWGGAAVFQARRERLLSRVEGRV
jgi:hypothetical protein